VASKLTVCLQITLSASFLYLCILIFTMMFWNTLENHTLRRATGNFPACCHETVQCLPFLHLSCPPARYIARVQILASCIQMHSNLCTLCDSLALSVYFALSILNAVCLHDWGFSIANTEGRSMTKNFTLFLGKKIFHLADRLLNYLMQIKPKLFEMFEK